MPGGQAITSAPGTLVPNDEAGLVGSAATSATGTLLAEGGDGTQAVTGSAATSAAGTTALNRFLPLRSRKIGSGTASALLSGVASVGGTGLLVHSESFGLIGLAGTLTQGTLLYRGRATISWNANTEPDLAGYRVYHGTTTGVYTEFVDVGNVTTYQWNGLLPGFTHYFVVTAYDTSNNESANSAQVSKVF